jgi:uncharacterized protein
MELSALLPLPAWQLAVGVAVTLAASTLQGTLGFGFAMLSVPILAAVDPALAPVPQLMVTVPLVFGMAWRERHAADLRGAAWVLLGRFPGAALGLMLVTVASRMVLDLVIAGIVFSGVIASVGRFSSITPTKPLQCLAGIVSGCSAYVSSIGGPPLALLYRNSAGPALRSTLAVIFSFGLMITIGTRLAAGHMGWQDAQVALCLMPGVFGGLLISRRLTGKVEGARLRGAVLGVVALSALALVARALLRG